MKRCHRNAPFLFFNGNTFADISRQISAAIFADVPTLRRRELISAVAHYVAGVLDRETMTAIVGQLCRAADFQPGQRVKTLRGSLRGVITRILDDGRIAWRPDGASTELIALPESLAPDE